MSEFIIPPRPVKKFKPYYQDDLITIYHGDSREIAPTLGKFDLLLTDPPYGIGMDKAMCACKNEQYGITAAPRRDYGSTNWDDIIDFNVIKKQIDIAKNAIIFGGNYYPLPISSCWFFWDKVNGSNKFGDGELAWSNLPGAIRIFKFMWNGMLQGNMKEKCERFHPTQKPVQLLWWCIEQADKKSGNKVETILDCYGGSCTTARAAKDLKRKCVCIELEERYCELGAKRMAQEVLL